MGEDASLDDFLGGESSEQSEAEPTDGTADKAESTAAVEPETGTADDAEPASAADSEPAATTTYAWSDEGTACDACGEVVERRWQQDADLVCVECKDWERA